MAKYTEQEFYKPMVNTALKLGKILPSRFKSTQKAVDTSSFKNVAQTVKGLGPITTPYGGSTRFEKFHPGIDVAANIGTPVSSFVSGKVTEVQKNQSPTSKGFGNYVVITDASGNQHRYSHLNQAWVPIGSTIQKGQKFGTIGNTGSTYSLTGGTGAHLDYRIKNPRTGRYFNPISYLGM